jgi:hypothetical protein
LISLLLFGGESDLRDSGHPFTEVLSHFQIAAIGFRHLAADCMAQELGRDEEAGSPINSMNSPTWNSTSRRWSSSSRS